MGLFSWLSKEIEQGKIEAQNEAQRQRDYEAAKQESLEMRAKWADKLEEQADAARARGDHKIAERIEKKMERFGL